MILGASLEILLSAMQAIVYHVVGALAIKHHLVASSQDDGHALAHVVKVEYVQQFVFLWMFDIRSVLGNVVSSFTYLQATHYFDGNTVRCACAKHEAKVARGRDEGRLVGTLRLVLQVSVYGLRHDRVAQSEQAEKVLRMLFIGPHRVQQSTIVPAKIDLVVRIGRKVNRFECLKI